MSDIEKIQYIKTHIENTSYFNICDFLKIHRRTLYKLMIDNNIVDNRIFRYCSFCGEKVVHKDVKNRIRCENENKRCNNCMSQIKREKYIGVNNPFFGKHHLDETKQYLRTTHKGKRFSINTEFKSGFVNNQRMSNYEWWVINYGEEIAKEKNDSFKKKLSLINGGSNNPMYGKPSPIGSGNGWSGWYNGWFFRSLLELSYMIFVIERFNLKWENGENKKNKIGYILNGVEKNYFPDFIIGNKYVIECKPRKLQITNINKIKEQFAKYYCDRLNLTFKYVDCYKIKESELIKLYEDGKIKFTKKYETKIKTMLEKHNEKANHLFI